MHLFYAYVLIPLVMSCTRRQSSAAKHNLIAAAWTAIIPSEMLKSIFWAPIRNRSEALHTYIYIRIYITLRLLSKYSIFYNLCYHVIGSLSISINFTILLFCNFGSVNRHSQLRYVDNGCLGYELNLHKILVRY